MRGSAPFLLMFILGAPAPPALDPTFIPVPAGEYWVGEEDHPRNPRRVVTVEAFEIGATEVTNAQFARFVEETGYISDSERNGFGMTFEEGMADWEWSSTKGATWRFPFGPDKPGAEGKPNHPVTQVSFNDARAYCKWAGGRLPTVEEWEIAARAGVASRWPWGKEFAPEGEHHANTWQGETHEKDTRADGHLYTAPVRSYAPNAWGLYDVIGNVFEYCTDKRLRDDEGNFIAAAGRGGSWWCSPGTCDFFNLVDIGRQDPRATLANQGFRVVRDVQTSTE